MSFWRKIAGLAVRNLDEAECDTCPPGLPGEDPSFSTAVTALGAKLAKADGCADAGEYDTFAQVFQSEPGSEGNVRRLYQLARQTTRGFESYARRLKKRYRRFHQHVVVADGRAIEFYRKCGFTRAGKTEPMWIYAGADH